jgi:hypothetical protein
MTLLWEKLDGVLGGEGKLPKIQASEAEVLKTYDEDSDGHLSRSEFHGFAQTYFSRMQWPMWRTAVRGAVKGVALFVVNHVLITPMCRKVAAVVVPRVVDVVRRKVGQKCAQSFALAKSKFETKFQDTRFLTVADKRATHGQEGADRESRARRRIRLQKLAHLGMFMKGLTLTAAVGGTASVAGLV